MTPSRMSARELTIVQLGGAICMPSIFAGYALVRHYQLAGAITALIIGNAILWYIARIMLKMTMVKRLNTAECVAQILGIILCRGFNRLVCSESTCCSCGDSYAAESTRFYFESAVVRVFWAD